jgi:predicted amidohydrolase YtcJ
MTSVHITNGRLYLGDGRWERGELLVRDGRIVCLGAAGELEQIRDDDTVVVDAAGASVLPGFHDTHVHPPMAGSSLLGIDLSPAHDADEYRRIIEGYVAAHPDLPAVEGVGWYGDVYPGGFPTRQILDEIVSDRPAIITSHDGHGVWVNSRALEAAGVGDDDPDPTGGRFVRDERGRLTGIVLDTAMARIDAIRPGLSPDAQHRAILAAQKRLHSVGITTWHDAAVGKSELGPDTFDAYLELDARGELTARVVLCQWWDRDLGFEQIESMVDRRDRVAGSGRLSANVVKIMQDGVIENHTGAMLQPYTDAPGRRGDSFIEPHRLNGIVAALDARGFDVHLHAVGDRAVRECLDAVEYARRVNGPDGGRHQIAHLDVVDPEDRPRFAALGVTANVQMLWARTDTEIVERKLPAMGAERARLHFPFGSLHRAGARLAAGSDWPVSDPNPLWAVHTGVTRLAPSTDPHATGPALREPLLPEEALPFGVALDAFTGNGAWVGRLEGETGALAPRLAADLVILDRDVSDGTGLDVAEVVATYIGGVPV